MCVADYDSSLTFVLCGAAFVGLFFGAKVIFRWHWVQSLALVGGSLLAVLFMVGAIRSSALMQSRFLPTLRKPCN